MMPNVKSHGVDCRRLCEGQGSTRSGRLARASAKMLGELQVVSGIDPANAIQAVQDELAIIEAGLEELKPPPGSLPENDWS